MVSVGELSERKNHKMVLEAWKKIKSNEIWYLICGQGALAEELLERAKQLGIAERFRLLGYRSDVIEVVAVSDLFVFPSKQEGLPVALMEAMAVGVPCVVSNIRGNRELVSKECGGLFSLDNPEEFAAQLAKVIRWNIQERRLQEGTIKGRIKKENRKKLKKYSREVVGNKMAEIYFNVCREE